ncbi:universal stress protein [Halanaeroarchaeum sulfurireducens]|uniref:UspA domain-containing protein n=1 Tax=Halanaeroarchaeum sulfurireducens TaxID=1604004 RepID=A0A0F7P6N4_9EURY|nr:universal stress protein [Halanaeroarchaeum sulfurireducens]AKH96826.1 UspA domain-containing protein [Halanaeroarchaeum sulfurireducens]ALG81228.1 UspA domain-containing protein [Halanaeroarchaeum sulfurireducens]
MNFLVAVDGSNESLAALERAIEMADPVGASVTVVHAVNPDVYELGGMEPITTLADADERLLVESLESAEERGEDILSEAASVAEEQGFDVDVELLYGQPAQQIVEYADEHGVDAVYLGHRGMSDRLEGLLGSVAKSVLGQAEVPVTVVP